METEKLLDSNWHRPARVTSNIETHTSEKNEPAASIHGDLRTGTVVNHWIPQKFIG